MRCLTLSLPQGCAPLTSSGSASTGFAFGLPTTRSISPVAAPRRPTPSSPSTRHLGGVTGDRPPARRGAPLGGCHDPGRLRGGGAFPQSVSLAQTSRTRRGSLICRGSAGTPATLRNTNTAANAASPATIAPASAARFGPSVAPLAESKREIHHCLSGEAIHSAHAQFRRHVLGQAPQRAAWA
jgi:hypothetical protein